MRVAVLKFGGTSVRDENSRMRVYEHIKEAVNEGLKVVVVVSAMGRKGDPYSTDSLLDLIDSTNTASSKREVDLLLSCGETISCIVLNNLLNKHHIKATALTGSQAGINTNNDHTNAKIIEMKCDRIYHELNMKDVVVVTGFQGISQTGEVTTLGRGGSDTSAAALGAALNAEYIDIFTDVEGVMTADPRIVKDAKPLTVLTYNEICNLAYQGAKVIHPRAVEIAMQAKVPIHIRSTYSNNKGTLVTDDTKTVKGNHVTDRLVTGIAHVSNVSQIKILATDCNYLIQTQVFKAMAQEQISVDFINISPNEIIYTVMGDMTSRAVTVLQELGHQPKVIKNCAKVSAVGAGMSGVPGVTSKIVTALSKEGIPILQSADSYTTIWVLVYEKDLEKAVNALHSAFELNK